MAKQKHFFATSAELCDAFRRAEASVSIFYVDAMLSGTKAHTKLNSLEKWPNLSNGPMRAARDRGFFFVFPKAENPKVELLHMDDGSISYGLNPVDNPSAFVIEPGRQLDAEEGLPEFLVGKFAMTYEGSGAAEITYKKYTEAFLKGFIKRGVAYYGLQASAFRDAGADFAW
jgi:hypothetical protein